MKYESYTFNINLHENQIIMFFFYEYIFWVSLQLNTCIYLILHCCTNNATEIDILEMHFDRACQYSVCFIQKLPFLNGLNVSCSIIITCRKCSICINKWQLYAKHIDESITLMYTENVF